jgi:uncharacterized protein with ATP-grasp and redox domains
MQMHPECLPCFARQIRWICQTLGAPTEDQLEWSREAMRALLDADWHASPPEASEPMHRRLRELSGVLDPYAEAKKRQNAHMLTLLPALTERVRRSPDPLAAALRLSMAGNGIDLGIQAEISDSELESAIDEALSVSLDHDLLARLKNELETARSILFVADNSGEIVLDRLLLDQLPQGRVTVVVRGEPVLNDVTAREAEQAGLNERFKVISNGTGMPGTSLTRCSPALRRAFAEADVVLSKGHGNFESLHDAPKDIYFLFKIKCAVVAEMLEQPVGSLVFAHRETLEPPAA